MSGPQSVKNRFFRRCTGALDLLRCHLSEPLGFPDLVSRSTSDKTCLAKVVRSSGQKLAKEAGGGQQRPQVVVDV